MSDKGYLLIQDGAPSFVPCEAVPTLAELQRLVGGFIEVAPVRLEGATFIVNEEGKLVGQRITAYIRGMPTPYDILNGPIVVLGGSTRGGNWRLLPKSRVALALSRLDLVAEKF